MLPNHQRTGESNLANVTITYIDKEICDIDASDDEDTNNNDLLRDVCDTKAKLLSNENSVSQLVFNNDTTKMTIPQANEALIAQRMLPMHLKAIKASGESDLDTTDGCFGDQDDSEHECVTGINVKFQDLIYRARPGFSWDRCKCKWQFTQFYYICGVFSFNDFAIFVEFTSGWPYLSGFRCACKTIQM